MRSPKCSFLAATALSSHHSFTRVQEPSSAICIVTADRVGVSIKHGDTTYSPDGGTLGLLLFCASGAQAQGPNCGGAKMAIEAVICQTPRL
jgi:hypothetical protein